jgi:hypothetical protein
LLDVTAMNKFWRASVEWILERTHSTNRSTHRARPQAASRSTARARENRWSTTYISSAQAADGNYSVLERRSFGAVLPLSLSALRVRAPTHP